MDKQDKEQMRSVALGAAQATFFGGFLLLFGLLLYPEGSMWVGYVFGPLYLLAGGYIWWALAGFNWTMPHNVSDND